MKSISALLRVACRVFACTAGLTTLHADVVLEWNAVLSHYVESQPGAGLAPYAETRAYAMVHVIMAKVAAAAPEGAALDVEAAMAQAAHDVLIAVMPEAHEQFAARLASQLAIRPGGPGRQRAVVFGGEQARTFLHERAYDLGPVDHADATAARRSTPFVLSRDKPLRAPVPDAPSVVAARLHFDRARELQALLEKEQVAARKAAVRFWAENPSAIWNRAARELAAQHGLPSQETARLFALLNVALADAFFLASESRAYFGSVRTESRFLALGDASTMWSGDTGMPMPTRVLVQLPVLPDYPSIPATMSGAAARVLTDFFGSDDCSFTLNNRAGKRSYTRFSIAAKECAFAGLYSGTDYREACIAGYLHGISIAKAIAKKARFAAQ